MAKGKARDKQKESYWQHNLDSHSRSGLSIREFCRRHGLAETAFYFWRREIAQRQSERTLKPKRRRALFIPVRVTTEARPTSGGEIAIALADGRRIELTPPVDRQSLSDVLSLLETPAC